MEDIQPPVGATLIQPPAGATLVQPPAGTTLTTQAGVDFSLPAGFEAGKYTEDDFMDPAAQDIIRQGMVALYGDHFKDKEGRELVENFLNAQRGVAGGNSLRGARELFRLSQLDDENLRKVGEMYYLFENKANIFSEENTWAETAEGIQDYARSALLDPINILSLGVGKAFALGGGRAATAAARTAAMAEIRKQLAAGATREVAEAAGRKVFSETGVEVGKEALERITQRTLQQGINRTAIREVGASTVFDTAVAIGSELAYQETRIRTGVQDEYSWANAGLAAVGVMALGGISAGLASRTGTSGLKPLDRMQPESAGTAVRNLVKDLTNPDVETNRWSSKVFRGLRGAENLSLEFWPRLLYGDSEVGVKGLVTYFMEEGFYKADKEQRLSDWVGEILRGIPEEDFKALVKGVSDLVGVEPSKLKGLNAEGKVVSGNTVDGFVDIMSAQASRFGKGLGAIGNASRTLSDAARTYGKEIGDITPDEYYDYLFDFGIGQKKTKSQAIVQALEGSAQRFQNNTIRMIVSNIGTTALNVQGYAMSTLLNTASDVSIAALHGGKAGLNLLLGNIEGATKAKNVAAAISKAQVQKVKNLLDMNTTYDTFSSLALARPRAMRELMMTIAGGVDDLKAAQQVAGFDPKMTRLERGIESVVDMAQTLNLVKAQDVATKALEYNYWLDRGIRLLDPSSGRGLAELSQDSNELLKFMGTEEFAKIHAKAVYETQRAIFSQSFKDKGTIGEIAAMIEDMRNIPGLGLLVPFGRFFNNTIATLMDVSGLAVIRKLSGGYKNRSMSEITARAAISWAFIASIVDTEADNIREGLDWDEAQDAETGEIISYRYSFPFSMLKAAARLLAYHRSGVEVPPEEAADIGNHINQTRDMVYQWEAGEVPQGVPNQMVKNVFGQLTRDLVNAGDGVMSVVEEFLRGEANVVESFASLLGSTGAQVTSAWTRTLEPLNYTMALARGVDFREIDRKQGSELVNNSIRYIDQFLMTVGVPLPEQRYNASSGAATLDPTKFIGVRSSHLSNTERVLNVLGVEDFRLNELSGNAEGSNRYNRLFNSVIEDKATQLWESDRFRRGDLRTRQAMWEAVKKDARRQVIGLMESQVMRSEDAVLRKSMRISQAYNSRAIEAAMADIGLDDFDYTDLTSNQLDLLEAYLKHREDVLMLYGNE